MKKYLRFRFMFYYFIMLFLYYFQIVFQIAKEFDFVDNVMWDQALAFVYTVVICFMYLWAIFPTVILLKMNKNKPYKGYWFDSQVIDKEKVYGKLKTALYIGVVAFFGAKIITAIERLILYRPVFTTYFWFSWVVFGIDFGVTALMTGIYLELRKKK